MKIEYKSVMGSEKKFYVLEDDSGCYIGHADTEAELTAISDNAAAFEEDYANDPDVRIVLPYQDQMDEDAIKELSRRLWESRV